MMGNGDSLGLRIAPKRERPPSSQEEAVAEEIQASPPDQELQARVEEVLEAIRPAIQADGGDIKLKGVRSGVVEVQLVGNCDGCVLADMTVKEGLERVLKDRVEGVRRVVTV